MVMPLRLGHLRFRTHGTAIEIHEAPVWRGVGKNHAAPAPVAGRMRPGARPRIAHATLLRQGQGNAPLLQVHLATAPWQGSLERGELLGKVGPRWGRRTRCWGIGGAQLGCCRWLPGTRRWGLAALCVGL